MLMILNDVMPYIGLALCLVVWRLERFNTKPFSIQFTLIVWIVIPPLLYIADNNPKFHPTFGSVAARYLILLSIVTVASYVFSVTRKIHQLSQTAK